jgi:hypothetical protein
MLPMRTTLLAQRRACAHRQRRSGNVILVRVRVGFGVRVSTELAQNRGGGAVHVTRDRSAALQWSAVRSSALTARGILRPPRRAKTAKALYFVRRKTARHRGAMRM